MNTTIKPRNRILSLALALCLLLGMPLYLPGPVEVRAANVELGTAADLTPDPDATGTEPGNQVYFGEYNGDPILWRVLENDNGEALLFSESILHTMPFTGINQWVNSPIREYLNTELLEKLPGVLQGAIVDSTIETDGVYTTDKLYLLSVEEANVLENDDRKASDYWWLRSPGLTSFDAAVVYSYGRVSSDGSEVYNAYGIRPAFRLNLSSAIFISAGDGTDGFPWVVGQQGDSLYLKDLEKDKFIQIQIGNEDTLWKVIKIDGSEATLLCTKILDSMAYNDRGNIWALSDARAFLNPATEWDYAPDTFSFEEGEREAIKTVTATEKGMTTNDTLFLLSQEEATNPEYFSDDDARKSSDSNDWWLRSPDRSFAHCAAVVLSDGSVYPNFFVCVACGIRPAFRLDLSSVLFTSAAVGGKPVAAGDPLSSAAKPQSGAVKLTVLDDNQKLEGVALTGGNGTDTLEFSYTFAKTGADQYISCVLVDDNEEVAYYGKLEDTSSSYTGTANVPLAGVSNGDYTLKIFSEQVGDDKETDYAGGIHGFAITVIGGMGAIEGSDATLERVAAQTISVTGGDGSAATPFLASIGLGHSVESIADSDLVASDGATARLYADGTYTTPESPVDLDEGANDLYIKVESRNGLSEYCYRITATRALPGQYVVAVNANPGLGGAPTVTPNPATATQLVTLEANPAGGYTFDCWESASPGVAIASPTQLATTFTMPHNDVEVVAHFTQDSSGGNNGDNSGGSIVRASTTGGSSRSDDSSGASDTAPVKTQIPDSAFSWDGERTLTIDYDGISALGLTGIQWNGVRTTAYTVHQGSVIVRFDRDFIGSQSSGAHRVRVEFLNHYGETAVTVGGSATSPEEGPYDDVYDDSIYNPNTGDDSRTLILLALLGCFGGLALAVWGRRKRVYL